MAWSANKTARDIVTGLVTSALPDEVTTVSASYGIALPAVRKTYTADDGQWVFPSVYVSPPRGSIDDGGGSNTTNVELWVWLTAISSSPAELDSLCEGYMSALVRTFDGLDGEHSGTAYYIAVTEFDTSPPDKVSDNAQVQTVAVKLTVTVAEAR